MIDSYQIHITFAIGCIESVHWDVFSYIICISSIFVKILLCDIFKTSLRYHILFLMASFIMYITAKIDGEYERKSRAVDF